MGGCCLLQLIHPCSHNLNVLLRSVMADASVAFISSATAWRSWRFRGCAAAVKLTDDCERFLPEGLRLEDLAGACVGLR